MLLFLLGKYLSVEGLRQIRMYFMGVETAPAVFQRGCDGLSHPQQG